MSQACFLVWSYLVLLLYCEFGERVTNEFVELDNEVCQLEWYLLPISVQRFIPFIMNTTQQPIILRGFQSCSCARESFKNVCLTLIQSNLIII